MKEKYSHLKELGERTSDYDLQKQIAEHLESMEQGFLSFRENSDKRCIYVLKVRENGGFWDGEYLDHGYFFDWETALAYGKKEKEPFEIEKYINASKRSKRIIPTEMDAVNMLNVWPVYECRLTENYQCLYQGRVGNLIIRFLFDFEDMKIVNAYPVLNKK